MTARLSASDLRELEKRMPSKQVEDVYEAQKREQGPTLRHRRVEATLQDKVNTLSDLATMLCDELHEIMVVFNMTRLIMTDHQARKDAGDMVAEVEQKIAAARGIIAQQMER